MAAGGLETYLVNALGAIDRDRFPCTIVTTGSSENWFAEELTALGVDVVHCPNPYSQVGYVRRFKRLIRERGARIVCDFRNDFAASSLYAAARCGVPSRIALYRSSSIAYRPHWLRRAYARVLHAMTYRYATHVVGNSRKVLDGYYPGWEGRNDPKLVVSHNGITLARFSKLKRDVSLLRSLGIDPSRRIIAHVGRLHRSKNHETMLPAFAEVQCAAPDTHLLLVGDGDLQSVIEQQIAELGLSPHVTLAGRRKDIPALLGCADVFFFPSRYEGQPNALLEAMAAGLPAVASNIAEVREVIPEAMEAYLADVDDSGGFAQRLLQLLADADASQALGTTNRAHIERHFTIEQSAARLTALWERDLTAAAASRG